MFSELKRPETLTAFREIPGGDLFAGWKPDLRYSFDVFDELAEGRDPVRPIVAGPPGNSGSFWPGRNGSQYSILMVKVIATRAPFGNFKGARSGKGTKS